MMTCDSTNDHFSSLCCNSSNAHNHCKHVADKFFESLVQKPHKEHIPKVHIKDLETVRQKFFNLVAGGSESLQVISDFDRTISKFRHNGVRSPTCHGIFEMDPELTTSAKNKLKALTKKFYPIEFDPKMTHEEKTPHMVEWWQQTHDVIVSCGIHRTALAKTVRECGLVLRDKVREFTELLHNNQIPVLIFSAGLGDVIQLLLEHFNILTENVRVVSNFMVFNEQDVIVGFTEPIIHSFNKTAASIANGEYAQISSHRPCVLLLGDSTGDVHMADGAIVDDPSGVSGTVLRIGFLNEGVEANLEKYKSIYDIVLVNDETFTVPLKLMQSILRCHEITAKANEANGVVDGETN